MLTKEGCRARLQRFRQRLTASIAPALWDVVVIHKPEHLLYLANFFPLPNSLNLQSSSFLLIERDGPTTLFTDNWLNPGDTAAVDRVEIHDWYNCLSPARNRALLIGEAVNAALGRLGASTVGAELGHLPRTVAGAAKKFLEVEPILRDLREIKDADELAAIRRGIRTAEAAHAAAREVLRPGLTELEVYAQCVARAIVAAASPFVMMCDVASGPRAAQGGGAPTTRPIADGELLILDFFPYVEGYRGDITNTFVVGGRPSQEQLDLFHLVKAGLEAAEKTLRPGTPVREVFQAIDAVFHDLKMYPGVRGKRELGHHAGHAIGLCHPEAPELVPDSDRRLEAGMVITLEPGIYGAPTGGVRLEHNYLITAAGSEQLSHHHLGLA